MTISLETLPFLERGEQLSECILYYAWSDDIGVMSPATFNHSLFIGADWK